jgi:hypothetical protein
MCSNINNSLTSKEVRIYNHTELFKLFENYELEFEAVDILTYSETTRKIEILIPHFKNLLKITIQLLSTTDRIDARSCTIDDLLNYPLSEKLLSKSKISKQIFLSKLNDLQGLDLSVDRNSQIDNDDINTLIEFFENFRNYFQRKLTPQKFQKFISFFNLPSEIFLFTFLLSVYLILSGFNRTLNPFHWFPSELQDFTIELVKQDWATLNINRSVDGNIIKLGGFDYKTGLGTHANAVIKLGFNKPAKKFRGRFGVDDETNGYGSVQLIIFNGKNQLLSTPVLKGKQAPIDFEIPIEGIKAVELRINDGGDGITLDHASLVQLAIE